MRLLPAAGPAVERRTQQGGRQREEFASAALKPFDQRREGMRDDTCTQGG